MAGDRKADVAGLAIAMPILAIVAVVLRFRARRLMKIGLGVDDWMALTALIFTLALCTVTLVAVYAGGLGEHLEFAAVGVPADVDKFITFSQMLWVIQFTSVLSTGFTKISVVFFYKRIFVEKPFQKVCWVMIGISAAWTISFFFVMLLNCIPIEMNWRPTAGVSRKCVSIVKVFWSYCISDIVTDALILCQPWFQIWKLHMSGAIKIQIGSIFALGWFTVGAAIARTVISAEGINGGSTDLDYTYSRAPGVYWTLIPCCVGVVCSCLPTFRPLLSHYGINTAASSLISLLSSGSRTQKGSAMSNERKDSGGSGSHLVREKQGTSVGTSDRAYGGNGIQVNREMTQSYDLV